MSLSVERDQALRVALAQQISQNVNCSEGILSSAFDGVMDALETRSGSKICPRIRRKVWAAVSPDMVRTLRDDFIRNYCAKILGSLGREVLESMTEEQSKTGDVQSLKFLHSREKLAELRRATNDKIQSMKDSWFPAIIAATRRAGVTIPQTGGYQYP